MLIIKSSERNEESVAVTFMAKAKATYIVVACCDADDYSGDFALNVSVKSNIADWIIKRDLEANDVDQLQEPVIPKLIRG